MQGETRGRDSLDPLNVLYAAQKHKTYANWITWTAAYVKCLPISKYISWRGLWETLVAAIFSDGGMHQKSSFWSSPCLAHRPLLTQHSTAQHRSYVDMSTADALKQKKRHVLLICEVKQTTASQCERKKVILAHVSLECSSENVIFQEEANIHYLCGFSSFCGESVKYSVWKIL